jgi:rhodanese-related sulfurtransferase
MRFLLAAFCLLTAFAARAEVIDIDNAELAKLSAAGVPLVDIRTAPEWVETGIVPGSHLLTFFDERGKADPEAWLAKAATLGKPTAPIILICRTGNRTKAVANFLSQKVGYSKVYNVKLGIKDWIKEGRATAPGAPALTACRAAKIC